MLHLVENDRVLDRLPGGARPAPADIEGSRSGPTAGVPNRHADLGFKGGANLTSFGPLIRYEDITFATPGATPA